MSPIPVGALSSDRFGGGLDRMSSKGAKWRDEYILQLYPKVMAAVYSSQFPCRRSTYPRRELTIVRLNLNLSVSLRVIGSGKDLGDSEFSADRQEELRIELRPFVGQ
jgi:hypothetical protein